MILKPTQKVGFFVFLGQGVSREFQENGSFDNESTLCYNNNIESATLNVKGEKPKGRKCSLICGTSSVIAIGGAMRRNKEPLY